MNPTEDGNAVKVSTPDSNNTASSCLMSAQQVYERFEKVTKNKQEWGTTTLKDFGSSQWNVDRQSRRG